MSTSEPIYMRIPTDLKENLARLADERGVQLSDLVILLIQEGLKARETEQMTRQLTQENQNLRQHTQGLESQLESAKRDLLQARHAWEELSQVLSRPSVLHCRNCGYVPRVREVVQGICSQCGRSNYEVRPEFREITPGEVVRTGLAVTGGIAIAAALLNGLFGDSQRT